MKNIVANYRRFWNYFKCPKSISFLYFIYKRDIEIDGWREGGRKEEKNRQRKGGREGGEGGGERERGVLLSDSGMGSASDIAYRTVDLSPIFRPHFHHL